MSALAHLQCRTTRSADLCSPPGSTEPAHQLRSPQPAVLPPVPPWAAVATPEAVKPQQLEDVATPAAEDEDVTLERIARQRGCTISARPSKPLRLSVWPAASHTRVPTGSPSISPGGNAWAIRSAGRQ